MIKPPWKQSRILINAVILKLQRWISNIFDPTQSAGCYVMTKWYILLTHSRISPLHPNQIIVECYDIFIDETFSAERRRRHGGTVARHAHFWSNETRNSRQQVTFWVIISCFTVGSTVSILDPISCLNCLYAQQCHGAHSWLSTFAIRKILDGHFWTSLQLVTRPQ